MKYRKLLCVLLALALLLALRQWLGAEGGICSSSLSTTQFRHAHVPTLYVRRRGLCALYRIRRAAPAALSRPITPRRKPLSCSRRTAVWVFDLATGETSDENQNTSTQTALFRNGLLYIPLIFCASHFGLKVSMLEKSGRLSCPALYHRQRGLRRFALYREG